MSDCNLRCWRCQAALTGKLPEVLFFQATSWFLPQNRLIREYLLSMKIIW